MKQSYRNKPNQRRKREGLRSARALSNVTVWQKPMGVWIETSYFQRRRSVIIAQPHRLSQLKFESRSRITNRNPERMKSYQPRVARNACLAEAPSEGRRSTLG